MLEKQPTEEGKKRFPPTGFYEEYPCTCDALCDPVCKGKCGCDACHIEYSDVLSGRG